MGEMKVEHVLLFLVGAFLAYHMMGNCGCKRVEGFTCKENPGGVGCDCTSNKDCKSEWCYLDGFLNTCQNPYHEDDILEEEVALMIQRRCPGAAADGTEGNQGLSLAEWTAREVEQRLKEAADRMPIDI